MALQYGMNITASDMRQLLEKNDKQQNGIRTWRQLFGNASLGFNAQSDALTTNYSDIIAQAYKASMAQTDAIMGAGLSAGTTKELVSASRRDLNAAYDMYVQNYAQDVYSAAKSYGEEVGAIDEGLTERAENFSKLYNYAYKYLSDELYGATASIPGTADNGATAKYEGSGKNSKFAGYENVNLDYIKKNGLDYLLDENGQLMSWDGISQVLFDSGGGLTTQGVKFFDQMMNTPKSAYLTTKGSSVRSFDEWLSDTDSDLREWYISKDEFNHTFAGTNKGTAAAMTGRESTDDIYGAYEYVNTKGIENFNKVNWGEHGTYFQDLMKKYQEAVNWIEVANNTNKMNAAIAGAAAQNPYGTPYVYIPEDPYKKFPEVQKAWANYQSAFTSMYNEASKFFKEKMSQPMYDKWANENSALLDEYKTLVDEMNKITYGSNGQIPRTDIVNKMNDWYNRFFKSMSDYMKKYSYTGKTSGF